MLNNAALGLGHYAHYGVLPSIPPCRVLMGACTENGLMADKKTVA